MLIRVYIHKHYDITLIITLVIYSLIVVWNVSQVRNIIKYSSIQSSCCKTFRGFNLLHVTSLAITRLVCIFLEFCFMRFLLSRRKRQRAVKVSALSGIDNKKSKTVDLYSAYIGKKLQTLV